MELFRGGTVVCTGNDEAAMATNRNVLFLVIGALCAIVAILSYKIYEDHREPKGVQLNIGPNGISLEKK